MLTLTFNGDDKIFGFIFVCLILTFDSVFCFRGNNFSFKINIFEVLVKYNVI